LRPEVSAIVVHCHAGLHRSPSIAFAICDALSLPRSIIDWDWQERDPSAAPPNRYIYEVTLAALLKAPHAD
jgi:predicted protein tyrosine phosphatase